MTTHPVTKIRTARRTNRHFVFVYVDNSVYGCDLRCYFKGMLYFNVFCQLLGAVVWFLCFSTLYCELTTTEPLLQLCPNISVDCELLEAGQYP